MKRVTEGGDEALRVYLAEKLPDLFQRAADSLDEITIDRLVVLDRDGDGVSRVANQKPAAILGMIEQMAGGLGLDMEQLLRQGAPEKTKGRRRATTTQEDGAGENGRGLQLPGEVATEE